MRQHFLILSFIAAAARNGWRLQTCSCLHPTVRAIWSNLVPHLLVPDSQKGWDTNSGEKKDQGEKETEA